MSDDKLRDLTEMTEEVGGYDPEFPALDPSVCQACGGSKLLPVVDFDDAGEPDVVDDVACPFCQPPEEPGDL